MCNYYAISLNAFNHLDYFAIYCLSSSIADIYSLTDEFVCVSCYCMCEFDKCAYD